jgi:hypothetical protein
VYELAPWLGCPGEDGVEEPRRGFEHGVIITTSFRRPSETAFAHAGADGVDRMTFGSRCYPPSCCCWQSGKGDDEGPLEHPASTGRAAY